MTSNIERRRWSFIHTIALNLFGFLVLAAWNVSAFKTNSEAQLKALKDETGEMKKSIAVINDKIDYHIKGECYGTPKKDNDGGRGTSSDGGKRNGGSGGAYAATRK